MAHVDPRFPTAIRELWSGLKSEVIWVHGRWIMYRQLYGTSAQRVDVLNRSASTFFNVLQKVLLQDVQLSLSKLGDPAGSGSRTNMTLDALIKALEDLKETEVVSKAKPLVEAYDAACEKLRCRRNKSIAHFDLKTMLASKVTPLTGPSRAEIEGALRALREAMNCIELRYIDSQTAYEHFIMSHDGDHLISTLMQGLRYRELVQNRKIPHDDLRSGFKGEV